jgi:hypothetical protein
LQVRGRVRPVGISYRPSECADRAREYISVRKAPADFREADVVETEKKFGVRKQLDKRAKGKLVSDFPTDAAFDANLPDLARPVRIKSFYEAQVVVRRWMIRDKAPSIRLLCRKVETANSAVAVNTAIRELLEA